MSRHEFDEEITKNWDNINSHMNLLARTPKHKMIRVDLAKKIAVLRDDSKLSFKEIADKLWEDIKETEEADLISEDYVKNLYHRWIRKTKKGIT